MSAFVLMTRPALFVFHWHTGACGLANIERRAITAELCHGRPLGEDRNRRWIVGRKLFRRVDNRPPTTVRTDSMLLMRFFRHRKIIVSECNQVPELAWSERSRHTEQD